MEESRTAKISKELKKLRGQARSVHQSKTGMLKSGGPKDDRDEYVMNKLDKKGMKLGKKIGKMKRKTSSKGES